MKTLLALLAAVATGLLIAVTRESSPPTAAGESEAPSSRTNQEASDKSSTDPEPVIQAPTESPTDSRETGSLQDAAQDPEELEVAQSTDEVETLESEVAWSQKYSSLSAVELHEAHTELSKALGLKHSEVVQATIADGRAQLVSEEEFDFPVEDDPDIIQGGHFDGENYYKAEIHRFDEPELLLLRDELRWLGQEIFNRAQDDSLGTGR